MTTITCELSECMYNKKDRCQCDALGVIKQNVFHNFPPATFPVCDSYMELPEEEKD